MNFAHEIFKAYDIRGVVDTTLTPKMVEEIGKAFGSETKKRGGNPIVIGRDSRLSGKKLVDALCNGLLSTGCDVINIGEAPTPTLYFATAELRTGTGIQVTGSHNLPEYNGLKMMINGTTLSSDSIQSLKHRVIEKNFISGYGVQYEKEMIPQYLDSIDQDISLRKSLKVVIDCGNATASTVAPKLFRKIGCQVEELFCEINSHFSSHHPDPSELENLEDLIQAVKKTDSDLGIAFDWDGDRLGVVSTNGNVIWPDRQMILFSDSILSNQPGSSILYDVKCSQNLPKFIKKNGGIPIMCRTGHSYMKTRLKETGAMLAGERSGHIIFNDRGGGFDDGIYAGARICEILSQFDQSPESIFNDIPDTVNTPELKLHMDTGENYKLVNRLLERMSFEDAIITTTDGIRVDFKDGFGLIRASNTTPNLIMRFEASSQQKLIQIQRKFKDLICSEKTDLVLPF